MFCISTFFFTSQPLLLFFTLGYYFGRFNTICSLSFLKDMNVKKKKKTIVLYFQNLTFLFYITKEPSMIHCGQWIKISLPCPTGACSSIPCWAFLVIVQSLSHVWLFVTPGTAAHQASLSFTISQSLLRLLSIESVVPSKNLIHCHPLLLLPSILPSIRVFSKESAFCIRWPKYWNFNFSTTPSSEHSELISFRIDWFDLLGV